MQTRTETQANPAAKAKQTEKMMSPYELAADCLEVEDGDTRAATELLVERIMGDRAWLTKFAEELVTTASYSLISRQVRDRRDTIIQANRPGSGREAVEALGRVNASMFLDWPLAGGLRLRDARNPDLDDNALAYEKQARASVHRAKWLRRLRSMVPEGKKVGDVLTEEQIAALYFEEETNA